MIDPLFDPYEALVNCQSDLAVCNYNVQQLMHALNETTGHLKNLSEQHSQLTRLVKDNQRQIQQLKIEIESLKSRPEPVFNPYGNNNH